VLDIRARSINEEFPFGLKCVGSVTTWESEKLTKYYLTSNIKDGLFYKNQH